jgi:hypothetical protein
MKKILLILALLFVRVRISAQQAPEVIRSNVVAGITSSATIIDNRSQALYASTTHTFCATGTGTWSAQIQYQDGVDTGPWTSFSDTGSLVTNTSASCAGVGTGYHDFISFAITGSVSISYAGTRYLWIGGGGGGGGGIFLIRANNLSDLTSAATARTNLGLGSAAVQPAASFLQTANNLSDLTSTATARTNLGLGTFSILNNPLTTLGDLLYGGASGTPTRLAGNTTATREFVIEQGSGSAAAAPTVGPLLIGDIPTGYPYANLNGAPGGTVTSIVAACGLSGGTITVTGTISGQELVNPQTGTSYTILASDCQKLVTFNNASAVAVTVPAAGGSFPAGFKFSAKDIGAGTATLTPASGTIGGSSSLTLTTGQGCDITSDATNWQTQCGSGTGGGSGTPASCTLVATTSCTITGAVIGAAVTAQDSSGNSVNPKRVTGQNTTSPTCLFDAAFTGKCYAAGGGAPGTAGTPGIVSAVQTNSVSNSDQTGINFETGVANNGQTVVPSNSSGQIEKFQVTGILAVPGGGSGAGTLTGPLKGNGTGPFTIATFSDIAALWTGTGCSTTTNAPLLNGNCGAGGSGAAAANQLTDYSCLISTTSTTNDTLICTSPSGGTNFETGGIPSNLGALTLKAVGSGSWVPSAANWWITYDLENQRFRLDVSNVIVSGGLTLTNLTLGSTTATAWPGIGYKPFASGTAGGTASQWSTTNNNLAAFSTDALLPGAGISITPDSKGVNTISSTGIFPTISTSTNCSSAGGTCGSAAAGSVTVAVSATTVVVATTAVTANSQIQLTFDSSLGTKLSVTCNTTYVNSWISARTPGTSFTITVASSPSSNPACLSYNVTN